MRTSLFQRLVILLAACSLPSLAALAAQDPSAPIAPPPFKSGAPAAAPPAAAPAAPAGARPTTRPATTQPRKPPSAVNPIPQGQNWWLNRHNNIIQTKGQQQVDLLFIGDSITQGWEINGRTIWAERYAGRHAQNLGFSGDRTQHSLWRIKHNEVESLNPKLAILMIGTNNSNGDDYTAEEIAAGIEANVALLRERLPTTKILLLAIFPRGEKPNPQRQKNARASELASKVADGQMVHYLDIGPKFLSADGTIDKAIMPDFLHLSDKGYQVWADAIEAKVREMMGETSAAPATKPN